MTVAKCHASSETAGQLQQRPMRAWRRGSDARQDVECNPHGTDSEQGRSAREAGQAPAYRRPGYFNRGNATVERQRQRRKQQLAGAISILRVTARDMRYASTSGCPAHPAAAGRARESAVLMPK